MAGVNTYDVGETVEGFVSIYVNGALTDPSTLTFKFKNPSGTVTTLTYGVDGEVVKTTTGKYTGTFSASTEGDWYYGFFGTGTAAGGGWRRVLVRKSVF